MVKPGRYEQVAGELEAAVDAAGLDLERVRAPRVLEVPSRLLAVVGGASVRRLVPDRMVMLKANALEVTIHPSDVAVVGAKAAVARARAAIADRLTKTVAYMTTAKESQEIEDELLALRQPANRAAALEKLREIDGRLARLVVEYDEWEVLYRQRLQVERDLLRADQEAAAQIERGPIERVARAVERLIG